MSGEYLNGWRHGLPMEASVCVGGLAVCKKSTMEQGGHGQIMMNGEKTFLIKHVLVMISHRRMPYGI